MPGFILLEADSRPAMDPHLTRLQEAIAATTRGMTAEDFARHPEGKWSAAQILEHLYLTYTGTVKGFERCLQAGKPLATTPNFKQRIMIATVVKAGYLSSGRKAPPNTIPRGMPAEKVVED